MNVLFYNTIIIDKSRFIGICNPMANYKLVNDVFENIFVTYLATGEIYIAKTKISNLAENQYYLIDDFKEKIMIVGQTDGGWISQNCTGTPFLFLNSFSVDTSINEFALKRLVRIMNSLNMDIGICHTMDGHHPKKIKYQIRGMAEEEAFECSLEEFLNFYEGL